MTESEGALKQVSIIKLNLRQEVVEAISLLSFGLSLENLLRSNEEKTTVSHPLLKSRELSLIAL